MGAGRRRRGGRTGPALGRISFLLLFLFFPFFITLYHVHRGEGLGTRAPHQDRQTVGARYGHVLEKPAIATIALLVACSGVQIRDDTYHTDEEAHISSGINQYYLGKSGRYSAITRFRPPCYTSGVQPQRGGRQGLRLRFCRSARPAMVPIKIRLPVRSLFVGGWIILLHAARGTRAAALLCPKTASSIILQDFSQILFPSGVTCSNPRAAMPPWGGPPFSSSLVLPERIRQEKKTKERCILRADLARPPSPSWSSLPSGYSPTLCSSSHSSSGAPG